MLTIGLILLTVGRQDIALGPGVSRLSEIVKTIATQSHEELSTDAILKNQVL